MKGYSKTRAAWYSAVLLSAIALSAFGADRPLPNQQGGVQVAPIALTEPADGTVAATSPFTPRALLVNPTTGALKVEVASSVSATSGGNGSVQTAATGTNYTALSSQAVARVHVVNTSGTDIEVRQDGAGVALPVANGTGFTFNGISNASQLSIRRVDTSNTQVTVYYRWEN